ncbi:MAG: glycosyltransferase family 4 protein [Burkholderiales bacterium]
MNIAYLLNSYPMTSTTFIRREIEALEAAGVPVRRFASRHWEGRLVDPEDIAEQQRTHYLVTGNTPRVLLAFAKELLINPLGVARAFAASLTLWRNARGGLGRHAAYLVQAAYFRQQTAAAKIDHVHAHFATNASAIAMLAKRMGGPGYSFTVHGPDEFDNTERLSYDLKMRHARFIAAISNFGRVQLVRASGWAHWDKIEIVHCGLAMAEFSPDPRFDADNQIFVNVARFNAQKGLLLIPPALALLKAEFPKLKVVLIGDGEERPALEAAITKHGVAGMIELRGWQPNVAVREALRTSRALLLPSFAEGLPVVIMEAFALGRPVISTYIAGIPELLDASCGWIVPAGSVEALAQAMREALLANPETLRAMGTEGRRRSVAQHDVAVSAAQLDALFRRHGQPDA